MPELRRIFHAPEAFIKRSAALVRESSTCAAPSEPWALMVRRCGSSGSGGMRDPFTRQSYWSWGSISELAGAKYGIAANVVSTSGNIEELPRLAL
jgi:hypothetical protein